MDAFAASTSILERLEPRPTVKDDPARELEDKRLAELRKILTPAQTARLLIVLPELERKIQNQLRRAIANAQRSTMMETAMTAASRIAASSPEGSSRRGR